MEDIKINEIFKNKNLLQACDELFNQLGFTLTNRPTNQKIEPKQLFKEFYKNTNDNFFNSIQESYFLGTLAQELNKKENNIQELEEATKYDYMVFTAIKTDYLNPNKTQLASFSRALNQRFLKAPAVVITQYKRNDNEKNETKNYIAISTNIRKERQKGAKSKGEVIGKVSIIKDIDIEDTHRGHTNILNELKAEEASDTLFPKKITTYEQLYKKWLDVFSLKILGNQFYLEIAKWYHFALKNITFNGDVNKQDFTLKIITRTIFIWFLKEKNLIDNAIFDKNIIENYLLNSLKNNESTYYKAILQTLFFDVLNEKIENRFQFSFNKEQNYRIWCKDFEKLKNIFNKKTPFINGGLFDADKAELPLENQKICKINIPNFLFFGKSKDVNLTAEFGGQKKFQNTDVNGLIDILRNYKFTIEENTPIESVVALDPEFLGKIFESLLAVRNEETGEIARKSTGSFYTPREIVDYMIDESLLAYLKTKNIDIENFENINQNQKTQIIEAFDKLKILDPACGSGAYPMGILQKMQFILKEIDPENKLWFESLINSFPSYIQNEMRKKFQNENLDYLRKLGIIVKSIYGVDIQPIAVQISKLRCFLSLIIDQKTNLNQKDNFGVKPLPNLEFKFVAANTLIDVPALPYENDSLIQNFKEFEQNTNDYFSVEQENKIIAKEKIIKNIQNFIDFNIREINRLGKHKNTKRINEVSQETIIWNSFNNIFKEESVLFFNKMYFFPQVKDGFDIVIGNPPYVQIQKLKEKQKDFESQKFETYTKMGDIYALFYEKGNQLLTEKGILCYITSNKWMRAGYGEKLRKYLIENTNPLLLIDLGAGVFESATVDTNILIFEKKISSTSKNNHIELKATTYQKTDLSIQEYVKNNFVILKNLTQDAWTIGNDITQQIKAKIEKIGTPLKDWDISIYRGILTGFNEAFIIDEEKKNELIQKSPKSAEIIRPILRGRDIKKYKADFAGLYLITIPSGWTNQNRKEQKPEIFFKNTFPSIYEHLQEVENNRKGSGKGLYNRDDQGQYWWELRSCVYMDDFLKEKIVYSEIVREQQFYYDTQQFYNEATSFLMTGRNIKYLIALLNSNFVTWAFKSFYAGGGLGETGFRYKKAFLENLPIPKISKEEQKPFEELVDLILIKKSNRENTNILENQLDKMIYRLYELTEDEIKIIEI